MTRLPLSVSLVVLLGALCTVVPTPLVWTGALFVAVAVAVAVVAYRVASLRREPRDDTHHDTRRRRILVRLVQPITGARLWLFVRIALGVASLAAVATLLFASPTLIHTYTPATLRGAPEIVEYRGFYANQSDGTGTGYHWTQYRATLVFDFLVHRPLTLAVEMRSAAAAGGPDKPVSVEVNGAFVGELRPDPRNAAFQTLRLRFYPQDWGGDQTEIRLLAAPYQPGNGDPRTLGTMVRSITVDKSEAWSGVGRRQWLVWLFPLVAAAAVALRLAARRTGRRLYGYLSVALCAVGVAGAVGVALLLVRIGMIDRALTFLWYIAASILAVSFALAAATSPFGASADATLLRRVVAWVQPRRWEARLRAWLYPPALSPDTVPVGGAWRQRGIWRDAALVAGFAFAVRMAWVLLIPPYVAPDELDHYVYVSHIVEQANMPQIEQPQYPFYSTELSRSADLALTAELSAAYSGRAAPILPHYPLYYDYQTAQNYLTKPADRYSSGGGRATGYPPLYYLVAAAFYKPFQETPILTRLFVVRGVAALFGAATCAAAYLLGYALRGTRRWGVALGAAVALMPMFAFDTAIANNDAALNCTSAILILLLVLAWQRRGLSPALAFGIGLASGLVLLSKPTAFVLVALAGVFVLVKGAVALWAARPVRRAALAIVAPTALRPRTWVLAPGRAYLRYVIGLLVGYGPWLTFRLLHFGDTGLGSLSPPFGRWLATLAGASLPPAQPAGEAAVRAVYPVSAYIAQKVSYGGGYANWVFVQTVWGYFGWLDEPMPLLAYGVITFLTVIGLIGVGLQLVVQKARRPQLLVLLGIVFVHAFAIFFIAEYYEVYRKNGDMFGVQGRYFFPVLLPWLFLLLSGWHYLLQERPAVLRAGMFVMLALQLVGIGTLLAGYYGLRFFG